GVFEKVAPEIWEFSVSGFNILQSWLGYRMKTRAGKKSSPLDRLRTNGWQFDNELLDLLLVLGATIKMIPTLNEATQKVLAYELWTEAELPVPSQQESKASAEDEEQSETEQEAQMEIAHSSEE